MNQIVFLLFSLSLVLSQELTDDSLPIMTQHYDYLLVHFQVPGCEPWQSLIKLFNKRFQTSFDQAATILNQNETSPYVGLGTVNCVKEIKTCMEYKITTYPTLRLFTQGQDFPYMGGSESEEIIQFMNQKINGGAIEITRDQDIVKNLQSLPLVIIYFSSSRDIPIYENVASQFPTIPFLYTLDKSLKQKYSPQHDIVLYGHHLKDPLQFPTSSDISEGSLTVFIESNRYARVMNFTMDSANLIFGGMKTGLFLFYVDDGKQKDMMDAKQEFKNVATHFDQDKLPMVLVDLSSQASIRLANLLGLNRDDIPSVFLIKPEGDSPDDLKKYIYDESSIKTQKIVNFVTRFFDGKVLPLYKSQENPTTELEESIKVLNANNYEQFINDVTRDVLVLYYTPTCVHCKAILPTIQGIAKSLRQNAHGIKFNQLVVGKIDASQNDIPLQKITQYPTIYLFPTEQKDQPILYDGDRTTEGIIKWIKENGSFHKPKKDTQSDL